MKIQGFNAAQNMILGTKKKPESSSTQIMNSFGSMLKNKLSEVNALKLNSDKLTEKLATGDVKDIHEVMIAAEKARIAVEYTMALRNEVIKAYESIMNMR